MDEGDVAIKILEKKYIQNLKDGMAHLIREIAVHWATEECSGFVKLQELYED